MQRKQPPMKINAPEYIWSVCSFDLWLQETTGLKILIVKVAQPITPKLQILCAVIEELNEDKTRIDAFGTFGLSVLKNYATYFI